MVRQELVPSSCINHPERPSTVRCRRCNVPLCDKCKIVTAHGVYCSETCAEQMAVFLKKAAALEQPLRRARGGIMRTFARLAVLAGIIALGWYLMATGRIHTVWNWLMSVFRTVRRG